MDRIESQEADNIDAVRQIAARFLTTDDFEVKGLGAGMCNDNYLVESPSTKIVVRLSKLHREYKAFREYQKERWCMSKAHALEIFTPEALDVMKLNDRAYTIQSYIDGLPPAPEESLRVWEALGRYAKKIHTIAVSGWGENLKKEDGTFDETWEEHLRYNVESLHDKDALIKMGVLTPRVSKEIAKLFQALGGRKFQFGLCHGDISLRNALVDPKGRVYLLDWGCAKAEVVPHYEINEIRGRKEPDASLAAFLHGYGLSQEELEDMRDDLDTLALLRDIDTLRWAIDKQPDAIANLIIKVKISLERKFGT